MGKNWLGLCLCGFLFSAYVQTANSAEKEAGNNAISVLDGKTVSIEYTVTLEDKKVVDSNVGRKPLTFIQGSGQVIRGVEKALIGMKVGESKSISVPPEEAYGHVLKKAIVEVKRKKVPKESWKVGAEVQGRALQGEIIRGRVIEIKGDTAIIDFNHPLAGKTLYFDVKVLDIK